MQETQSRRDPEGRQGKAKEGQRETKREPGHRIGDPWGASLAKRQFWKQSENGFPLLENSLAWFDCLKWNYYSGGDHQILVGEVTSFNSLELEPLTFWNGQIS